MTNAEIFGIVGSLVLFVVILWPLKPIWDSIGKDRDKGND